VTYLSMHTGLKVIIRMNFLSGWLLLYESWLYVLYSLVGFFCSLFSKLFFLLCWSLYYRFILLIKGGRLWGFCPIVDGFKKLY
jgi:hypothetical protein